jgi:very-short-patch-repair endonuclease
MLMFPKTGRKPKKQPKLPRRRKAIKKGRTKFPADWGNGKRKRRLTDTDVRQAAQECRTRLLAQLTPEEIELYAILDRLGVNYERQRIFQNGDRWVMVDAFLPRVRVCLEADGFQHRANRQYDHKRSLWLAEVHKVSVVRFWNSEIRDGTAEVRIREMLGFGCVKDP